MSPHRSPIPALPASGAIRTESRSPRSSSRSRPSTAPLASSASAVRRSRSRSRPPRVAPSSPPPTGSSDAEFEAAVRAGVKRGIDDAEAAGALNPLVATGLRAIAARLPVDEAVALIEDARSVFEDGQGALDSVGGLLDSAGNLLPRRYGHQGARSPARSTRPTVAEPAAGPTAADRKRSAATPRLATSSGCRAM